MPEHGGPIKHFKTNKRRILSHKTVTEYFNSVSGAPKRYLMGLSVGCGPARRRLQLGSVTSAIFLSLNSAVSVSEKHFPGRNSKVVFLVLADPYLSRGPTILLEKLLIETLESHFFQWKNLTKYIMSHTSFRRPNFHVVRLSGGGRDPPTDFVRFTFYR